MPFQRLIIPWLPCRGEACFPSLFCPETMMAGMVPLNYLWAAHLKKTGWSRRFFPPGEYAGMTVRPRLGFLWGAAIGAAKRYFYQKWLPQSPYGTLNMEYELHTEKSIRSHPSMDIFFAVKRKE